MKIEVTDDASKIAEAVAFLDATRRSISANQKQVTIEKKQDDRACVITITMNGLRIGEKAEPKKPPKKTTKPTDKTDGK